ncbi:hypothetical protein DFH09DRAFT_1076809 [Mycena vulgaris]|nr:hypothetical protein DFH09DRAFT_1076809 [Mycena vulgaris]
MAREEYCLLRKNAAVVKQLEALFSLRYRDQPARTRQLTWVESDREDHVREMEEPPTERGRIVRQRIAMLNQYSTEELLEMNAVLEFLRAVAQEPGKERDYFQDDEDMPEGAGEWVLSAGPAAILHAPKRCRLPLQNIWGRRNVPAPPHADSGGQENPLLDPITFRFPPCDQCNVRSSTPRSYGMNATGTTSTSTSTGSSKVV